MDNLSKQNKSDNIMDNCLQIAYNSLELGKATIESLEKQGEKIQNINININHIHQKLNRASKIINKMTSLFGFILPNMEDNVKIVNEELKPELSIKNHHIYLINEYEYDNKLDELLIIMSQLKSISVNINEIIDTQNRQFSSLDQKIIENNEMISKSNKKISDL